jgi:hypothetical protein
MEWWPCKKLFGIAPEEEMRKDMMEGSCNTAVGVEHKNSAKDERPVFPNPTQGGLDRLIRVYRYVFAATYTWRIKQGAHSLVLINPIGISVDRMTASWRAVSVGAGSEGDEGCRGKNVGSRCTNRRRCIGKGV